jgi:class 3 adenylate cyclase
MPGPQKKNLDVPDERLQLEGVAADIVQVGETSISRNVYQPGAHCALGGRLLAGDVRAAQSCQAHHTGIVTAGQLRVEMDDGSRIDLGPNEVFDVPPGHDGWVVGQEPVHTINWSGVRTWLPQPEAGERVLATMLFTDIVASTETAARIGDDAWHELLNQHNQAARDQIDRFRGREVKTTGDGFLVVFDGAARAVRAAIATRDQARAIGLELRVGVHTGEVEVVGDDVRGIAVHEAARVASAAAPGEVLVSATTQALASSADLAYTLRDERELKGLDGLRALYLVDRAG